MQTTFLNLPVPLAICVEVVPLSNHSLAELGAHPLLLYVDSATENAFDDFLQAMRHDTAYKCFHYYPALIERRHQQPPVETATLELYSVNTELFQYNV